MNKCLRITFSADFPEGFLQSFVQKHARKLDLEGVAQVMDNMVRVVACGDKDKVDEFLDMIYKGSSNYTPDNIEVEAFLKDKDYRGVFRIVE